MPYSAYVITEGAFDTALLKKLLPDELANHVLVYDGGGRSGAMSYARTLVAKTKLPLALVYDADTNSEANVQEQYDLSMILLKQTAGGTPVEVFVAVPEIEIILFQDQALLEKRIDHQFSPDEWFLAKRSPKASIEYVFQHYHNFPLEDDDDWAEFVKRKFTPEDAEVLRKHPFVANLIDFLMSVHERQHP